MRRFLLSTLLILCAFPAHAQNRKLTLDEIFDPAKRVNFGGSTLGNVTWTNDGTAYLTARRGQGMQKIDAKTGSTTPFFDTGKMQTALANVAGISMDEASALARQSRFTLNPAQTGALLTIQNNFYFYAFGSDTARKLTQTPAPRTNVQFSPDGQKIAYVRSNNLYVVSASGDGGERALTSDGGPKLLNGHLDWVYEEEIYGRGKGDGFWWSPDSEKIAFLKLDETPVREFVVVDGVPARQDIQTTAYPLAGDPNPQVKLGIVRVASAASPTILADTKTYAPDDFLLVRVSWNPDSKSVIYQAQNRRQTFLDLNSADAETGKTTRLLRETSPAWVDPIDPPTYLKDGSFLWQSDRTGFRHIYHCAKNGGVLNAVTSGNWDVRNLTAVDEAKNRIYFTAAEHSPRADHFYFCDLDGKNLTRLTHAEGAHRISLSPAKTLFLDTWSDVTTPPQTRLFDTDGKLARVVDAGTPSPTLAEYAWGKSEFVTVKARDGFPLEARIIRPPDFDPSKKYPVLCQIYGGPQISQVRDGWSGGGGALWLQYLAQSGYVIWICDPRAASNKGAASAWTTYHQFGAGQLRDLEDGLTYLKAQPGIDGNRIAIWGWSFGGFMTSYALTHSTSFRAGISGGTVADWRNYDSVYTERYLGTPSDNPDGYASSSDTAAAKNLHGSLLLLHGMIDDNVHLQNIVQFSYALQKAGKPFQMMLYPEARHGVSDPAQVRQMYGLMTDFLNASLSPSN